MWLEDAVQVPRDRKIVEPGLAREERQTRHHKFFYCFHVTKESGPREFFKTSMLVPALATVAALLKDKKILLHLRDVIHPLLEGVTLERWFPDLTLETLAGSRRSVQEVGASRALVGIRATSTEEAAASLNVVPGTAAPTEFKWFGTPFSVLAALSARFFRHPVPTWFLQQGTEGKVASPDVQPVPNPEK